MKLIVGLGNPGRDFARHRHNVGFRCVNAFARRHRLAFSRSQCRARIARGVVAGEEEVFEELAARLPSPLTLTIPRAYVEAT